ncbi:MAG: hypothetical protein M3O35_09690 [Acidobacteriota bacterium]|nr:hypothetical protein [Acidobacteriota bacterium]
MHVHTSQSGMCTIPVLDRVCRECYSHPLDVYQTLKRRGMNLVTITDHDSIAAASALRGLPGFFLSEEVSCVTPSGTRLHMGVYGIEEWHHLELQRRRDDLVSLIAFLTEQNLFFTINHVFSALTGPRTDLDFALFEDHFPGIETLNGAMLESCNASAAQLARRWSKAPVAGSDAHTLSGLGFTWTEVPGARNAAEYLEGVRHGLGHARGVSGSYRKLTATVLEIACSLIRERRWTALLAPLMLAIPAITLANALRETAFRRKWSRRLGLGFASPPASACAPEVV